MSDAYILRSEGSGGISAKNAVIHITAQSGSTITLFKNNIIVKVLGPEKSHIKANDSNVSDWYYSVKPSMCGQWTVKAELNTVDFGLREKSYTINVDLIKQYNVEITYDTYLFKNGVTTVAAGSLSLIAGSSLSNSNIYTAYNSSTGNYWQFSELITPRSYGDYLKYKIRLTSIATGWPLVIGCFKSAITSGGYSTNYSKKTLATVELKNTTGAAYETVTINLKETATRQQQFYIGLVAIATSYVSDVWFSNDP